MICWVWHETSTRIYSEQAVFCVLYNPETNQQTIQVEQGEIVYKTNAYALNIEAGEELNNAGGKVVFVEAIQKP